MRRGGEITIPEIVMHGLEMPDALPGFRIECQKRRAIKVRAEPIASVKIGRRCPDRNVRNASAFIDGAPGPRTLPDGSTIDLDEATNVARCGKVACAAGEESLPCAPASFVKLPPAFRRQLVLEGVEADRARPRPCAGRAVTAGPLSSLLHCVRGLKEGRCLSN